MWEEAMQTTARTAVQRWMKKWKDEYMRLIDADEVDKFYKNMGKEFPELSVGVHFSINDIINNLDNIDTVKNVNLGGKTAMTKYSDIEIKTAENLLEKGYKWIVRNETGRLFAHFAKPFKCKVNNVWGSVGFSTSVCDFVPIFQSIRSDDKEPVSLESIVHPQILDDAEREYLKGVIRPFKNKVKYITKRSIMDGKKEYIYIHVTDDCICLPCFRKGSMYKGMEIDRNYSFEELGL